MAFEELEFDWVASEDDLDDDDVLNEVELARLAYVAEHPEFGDPVWVLVGRGNSRGRGGRR